MIAHLIQNHVRIGEIDLYHADAIALLPHLERAALCVSDIPYALTTGGKSKSLKTMSGIFAAHNYANDGQLIMATVPFDEMCAAIYGALKDDADCYLMANDKNIFPLWQEVIRAGFNLHNLCVWDKKTATQNRWYMKCLEFTLYLWKGKARTINNPGSKQLLTAPANKQTIHPTEKPVDLMCHYILNSSKPGDLVLDPFMGSGTTLVAAARTGRRGIGIELEKSWFDVAVKRLRSVDAVPDLIGYWEGVS